jgi:hypothetical protein
MVCGLSPKQATIPGWRVRTFGQLYGPSHCPLHLQGVEMIDTSLLSTGATKMDEVTPRTAQPPLLTPNNPTHSHGPLMGRGRPHDGQCDRLSGHVKNPTASG